MENVIEESLYAAFNESGNEYLMMCSIVDYLIRTRPYQFLVRRRCTEVEILCRYPHSDGSYVSNGREDQHRGKI